MLAREDILINQIKKLPYPSGLSGALDIVKTRLNSGRELDAAKALLAISERAGQAARAASELVDPS